VKTVKPSVTNETTLALDRRHFDLGIKICSGFTLYEPLSGLVKRSVHDLWRQERMFYKLELVDECVAADFPVDHLE
jgi:hypothetical protein